MQVQVTNFMKQNMIFLSTSIIFQANFGETYWLWVEDGWMDYTVLTVSDLTALLLYVFGSAVTTVLTVSGLTALLLYVFGSAVTTVLTVSGLTALLLYVFGSAVTTVLTVSDLTALLLYVFGSAVTTVLTVSGLTALLLYVFGSAVTTVLTVSGLTALLLYVFGSAVTTVLTVSGLTALLCFRICCNNSTHSEWFDGLAMFSDLLLQQYSQWVVWQPCYVFGSAVTMLSSRYHGFQQTSGSYSCTPPI